MAQFDISVIIPCHNEQSTIKLKIENTLALGEKIKEIIIVDDYSTDNTYNLADKWKKEDKRIIAIKNTGMQGKKFAVKKGLKIASGAFICMTDADILLSSDTITKLHPYFLKKHIGGICLSPHIIIENNTSNDYISFYELFVKTIKILESKIDSVPVAHGQALFFRNNLNIAPTRQADDVDIAIQIRKKGYKVVYAKDCFFTEHIIKDKENLKKQKIRRSKAVIDSLLYHKDCLFNPKYGFFGFLCYPVDIALYIFSPFILLFGAVLFFSIIFLLTNIFISLSLLVLFLLFFTKYKSILRLNLVALIALYEYIKEGTSSSWKTPREMEKVRNV